MYVKRSEKSGWGEGGPSWGTSQLHFLFAGISASGPRVSVASGSSPWLLAVLSVTAPPDSARDGFFLPTGGSLDAEAPLIVRLSPGSRGPAC